MAFARCSFSSIVACSPCSSSFKLNGFCTIFLWPYSRAPSRQYFFGLAAAPPLGDIDLLFASRRRLTAILFNRLAAVPHGNSFYSALQRRLSAILFNLPRSGASGRFFFFRLMAAPISNSFYPALIQENSPHLLTWFCSV